MEQFWKNLADMASQQSVQVLMNVVLGIVVLAIGFRLVHWIVKIAANSRSAKRMDPTAASFIGSMLSIGLKMLLIIIVCGIVGIPTASIIAVLGSAGVAIGLAMQGSLSNFAGGVMILIFKPFVKGDYVDVPGGGAGTITDISIFYTTLLTPDNRRIVVPNGTVSNANLTNYSAMPVRRMDIGFSTAYGSDPEQVRKVVLALAQREERILPDPAPMVLLDKMAESSLNFILRCWCEPKDYVLLPFSLNEQILSAMRENGISIPYPQLDVHVKTTGKADAAD